MNRHDRIRELFDDAYYAMAADALEFARGRGHGDEDIRALDHAYINRYVRLRASLEAALCPACPDEIPTGEHPMADQYDMATQAIHARARTHNAIGPCPLCAIGSTAP